MSDETVLGAVVGLLVALAATRVAAFVRRLALRRRMARARVGERTARALLVRRGFEILAEQAEGALVLHVDGAPSAHALRVDYLVTRGGRRFVAEVKTGAIAPSLDHAPTRRQILEYAAAFDVDGALLVDPEHDRIREIALPRPPVAVSRWAFVALALGAALAVLVTSR